jgi:hypothetical protein
VIKSSCRQCAEGQAEPQPAERVLDAPRGRRIADRRNQREDQVLARRSSVRVRTTYAENILLEARDIDRGRHPPGVLGGEVDLGGEGLRWLVRRCGPITVEKREAKSVD